MRTAITLAIHKGGELVEMLEGPLTPIDEQRVRFKQARQSRTHDTFQRIELWESGSGRVMHHDYYEVVAPQAPVEPPPAPVEPAHVELPPAPVELPAAEQTEADTDASDDFDVQPAAGRRRRR
jgi:hypothetical protein